MEEESVQSDGAPRAADGDAAPGAEVRSAPADDARGRLLRGIWQYAGPTAVASLVATVLSVFTALNAAHDKQREYNAKFEDLVIAPEIRTAFGGTYAKEQQATAILMSLQSLAESEIQRRTVLLIGARLLNADPKDPDTGGPAARLLTILIDQADVGRDSWNPSERRLNEHLWDTINSQSFKDLVTAGYSNDYFTDDRIHKPTADGDEQVNHDAKFQVLWKLTPADYDGWVHLATYRYTFPHTAQTFVSEMTEVTLRQKMMKYVGEITAQYYAITDTRKKPSHDPLFVAPQRVGGDYPRTLVMIKHRLLRSRPPVQYINPDTEVRKGSLGKIIGVVPAGSCIVEREPMQAVLVFPPFGAPPKVNANASTKAKATQKTSPKVKTKAPLTGFVHLWAHVHGSKKAEEACPDVK